MSVFGIFGLKREEEEILKKATSLGKGEAELLYENGKVVGVRVNLEIRFPQGVEVEVSVSQQQQAQQQPVQQKQQQAQLPQQPKQEQQAPQQPKEKVNLKQIYEELKKNGVFFKKENDVFVACGKTYVNRNGLRKAGFKWDQNRKAWTKPATQQAKAQAQAV